MIRFVPYEPAHLHALELQPAQAEWFGRKMAEEGYAETLNNPGWTWTGFDDNGRLVGCAGLTPQWPGRAIAWALFGRIDRHDWLSVVIKVRQVFRDAHAAGTRRIEASVVVGFGAGCRLALATGFKIEGRLRAFGPDGADHFLYSKVAA